jgi:hypothetical protein
MTSMDARLTARQAPSRWSWKSLAGGCVVFVAKLALAAIAVTALYQRADWGAVVDALGRLHAGWIAFGLVLFVPQTIVSAARWRWLVRPYAKIGMGESVRQTLAASALNLIMPAKMGDIAKAALLDCRVPSDRAKAAACAVVEKAADVLSLATFIAVGLAGRNGWQAGAAATFGVACLALFGLVYARRRGWNGAAGRLFGTCVVSLALWALHLAQLETFVRATGVAAGWHEPMVRLPLCVFAGLVPFTWCGVGTRDAALVWLYSDFAPASVMAGVGALTALRYIIPGLAGIGCLAGRRRGKSRMSPGAESPPMPAALRSQRPAGRRSVHRELVP